MTPYGEEYAAVYDLLYADKPYVAEAEFVAGQLRSYGIMPPARMLDIACGTGRHASAFCDMGYRVVGVDGSAAMIGVAQQRDPRLSLVVQDMRNIDLRCAPFDAAVCLFDSIGWVTQDADLRTCLEGIRRHTRTDGIFVVEYLHARAMLGHFEPIRIVEADHGGVAVTRRSRTSLMARRRVARIHHTIHRRSHDGTPSVYSEECHVRFFDEDEFAGLLRKADFQPLTTFAGYTPDRTLSEHTWHLITVARAGVSR